MNSQPSAITPAPTTAVSRGHLLLVVLVAVFLRLFGLDFQSLWYDEVISSIHSQRSYAELPEALQKGENTKPPLYYVVLHEWLKLGKSDTWLRLPSAISGSVACVLAALVGGQLLGGRVGWWVGLCLAVSPMHVWYSQEARMYALLTAMGFAALWFHLRFLSRGQWVDLAGYALFALLSCYTFTYGIFILGFCFALTLCYRPAPSKITLLKVAVASGLAFAGFLPWALRIAAAAAAGTGFQPVSKGPIYQAVGYTLFVLGFGVSLGPTTDALRVHRSAIFGAEPVACGLMIAGLMLFVVLIVAGAVLLWKRARNAFWFATLGALAFWGAPAVLTLLKPGIAYNPRYAILALLPVAVFLAGAALPGRLRKSRFGSLALFAICVAISLWNHFFDSTYGREDGRGAARIVAAMPSAPARVVLCPEYLAEVYERYQTSPAPARALKLAMADAPEQLETLRQELADAPSWVLVYGRKDYGDPQGLLATWLEQHFQVVDRQKLTGLEVLTVAPKR